MNEKNRISTLVKVDLRRGDRGQAVTSECRAAVLAHKDVPKFLNFGLQAKRYIVDITLSKY